MKKWIIILIDAVIKYYFKVLKVFLLDFLYYFSENELKSLGTSLIFIRAICNNKNLSSQQTFEFEKIK